MPNYTSKMAGSGQFGICDHCNKTPTKEGHDGCLGTLKDKDIMNACCGHGDTEVAYIQYWTKDRISGQAAIDEQSRLIKGEE